MKPVLIKRSDNAQNVQLFEGMNETDLQFTSPAEIQSIESLYEQVVFRGTLIARNCDQRFGRLKLDNDTAKKLGTENSALFIERCPSFDRMIEHFYSLGDNPVSSWIVVASSVDVLYELERLKNAYCEFECKTWPANVVLTAPEKLASFNSDITASVAGILLFDYACHVHKCRGFSKGGRRIENDRPQRIVDFRSRCRIGDWTPPLLFCTNKPAISVPTLNMLSPYCIDSIRYIDGQTMRFGCIN